MQQVYTLSPTLILRTKEAFVRSVVWAFIGILYGLLFLFFAELAKHHQLPIHPFYFAAVLAGAIGALIYSSMRLAVLLASIISPLCILIMILASEPVPPAKLIMIVAPAGAVIGAFYGLFSAGSRIYRADAKTLAGFSAGFIVGLGYLILSEYLKGLHFGLIVAAMCIATGWLYVLFVPTFIRTFTDLLPPVMDGALVGAGVAIFLVVSLFIMTTSIEVVTRAESLPLIQQIDELLPQALTGGLLGGAFAGFISGLALTKWQDL